MSSGALPSTNVPIFTEEAAQAFKLAGGFRSPLKTTSGFGYAIADVGGYSKKYVLFDPLFSVVPIQRMLDFDNTRQQPLNLEHIYKVIMNGRVMDVPLKELIDMSVRISLGGATLMVNKPILSVHTSALRDFSIRGPVNIHFHVPTTCCSICGTYLSSGINYRDYCRLTKDEMNKRLQNMEVTSIASQLSDHICDFGEHIISSS